MVASTTSGSGPTGLPINSAPPWIHLGISGEATSHTELIGAGSKPNSHKAFSVVLDDVALNMPSTFVETALLSSRDACVCLDEGFVFAESVEGVNG
jgi:hypothetical protein